MPNAKPHAATPSTKLFLTDSTIPS
jgi:hypothetical protein